MVKCPVQKPQIDSQLPDDAPLISSTRAFPCPGNEVGIIEESVGAFHYAKDSGNFGRNSNGKVRFGFF